jgi:type I restriction enzyme S subunit
MCTNQGFKSFVPDATKVFSKYLYYWLKANKQRFENLGNGATFKEVSKAIVSSVQIFLPALDEQRRIAAILDKADALRHKRQQAINKLDSLLQSTFLEMFGDPISNPKGWEVQALSELVKFRTGKLDANAAVAGGAYPFFTCSREDYAIDTYAFDCEALLLAGNNATADYSVKHYNGKFNAYQRTYVITLLKAEHSYFYMQCALENKLQEMKKLSKGTNTKYLTLSILNNLRVQVPPPDEQQQFEAVRLKLNEKFQKHNCSLRLLDDLFHSIQQRAFNGELFAGNAAEPLTTLTASQPELSE